MLSRSASVFRRAVGARAAIAARSRAVPRVMSGTRAFSRQVSTGMRTAQNSRSWLVGSTVATLAGASAVIVSTSAASSTEPEQSYVNGAEEAYSTRNPKLIYDYCKDSLEKYPDSVELLWRASRACHDLAMETKKKDEKKSIVLEGYEYAKKALELDANHWAAQKWTGISLSNVGDFEDKKTKIKDAFVIREYFDKAAELNPKDSTTRHLIGLWCFTFADLAWYERKAASLLFATPPTSTYEEALTQFLEAEELEPNFYKKNKLMIAKCYWRLQKIEEAKEYINAALSMPVISADDEETHAEALKIQGKL